MSPYLVLSVCDAMGGRNGLKSTPNPDLQMRLDMFCRTVVASKGVKESRVEILFCNRAAEQQGF